MYWIGKHYKKFLVSAATLSVAFFLLLPAVPAQQEGGGGLTAEYLKKIMENTYGILVAVDRLPTVLDELYKMAVSWNADKPDAVAQLQTDFSKLGNLILQNLNTQTSLQPTLVSELFKGITPAMLSYGNDLTFQTLLGMPLFSQDPRKQQGTNQPGFDPRINYIKNAAGVGITHFTPEKFMNGAEEDVIAYRNYYNAVMAVESYNAFILSGLYADYEVQDDPNSQNPQEKIKSLTSLQNTLISQATSADWFTKIASEELGLVLRQLLLYESQAFVMMSQLLQTQKQVLATLAMNNTLTIAGNMNNERQMFDRANKRTLGG